MFHPPGLEAEAVLNEDGDAEEDDALYGHCKQVLSNHVPGQRGAESIFTCNRSYISAPSENALEHLVKTSAITCHAKLTKSLQSISHCLVLHHVDQSSAQTEVWEDEEHVLQDVIDTTDLLKQKSTCTVSM